MAQKKLDMVVMEHVANKGDDDDDDDDDGKHM